MKKIFSFLIACTLLLVSAQAAQSQFLWDHIRTDFDGQYYYCHDVLDCYGNDCIIAIAIQHIITILILPIKIRCGMIP